jgi:hypothetical protein
MVVTMMMVGVRVVVRLALSGDGTGRWCGSLRMQTDALCCCSVLLCAALY